MAPKPKPKLSTAAGQRAATPPSQPSVRHSKSATGSDRRVKAGQTSSRKPPSKCVLDATLAESSTSSASGTAAGSTTAVAALDKLAISIELTLADTDASKDAVEWQPAAEPDTLDDGAPKQVLRAASPEMMKWLLSKLGLLSAHTKSITTHDAVHGLGAKWQEALYSKAGFWYGPPTTAACIRAITMPGKTSFYYFVTQHPEGETLRAELQVTFGDGWQSQCFGRATHMLSHSWGMPFVGFINALSEVPAGSFVWNDILAINQHGDAGPLAREAMAADLNSLESIIRFTKRIVLYFDPLDDPAPIKRVWCLFEVLTLVTTAGGQLMLGFTKEGKKQMYEIAKGFDKSQGSMIRARSGGQHDQSSVGGAQKLQATIKKLDSQKAKATVPADAEMIKGKIVTQYGGHQKFNFKLIETLNAAVMGYASHLELAATWKAFVASPKDDRQETTRATREFLKALARASPRILPLDPIKLGTKSINLSGLGMDGQHAKGFAQFIVNAAVPLTSLNLHNNKIKDEGIAALCKALQDSKETKLASLTISASEIGHMGAKYVATMAALTGSLTEVNLDGFALPVKKLQGIDPVKALDLSGKGLCVASAIVIATLIGGNADLTSLNVCDNSITGDGAQELARVVLSKQNLESFCDIPVKELRADSLKELNLSGNGVGVPGALVLAELLRTVTTSLTCLNLGMNSLMDAGVTAICEAVQSNTGSKLTELIISRNRFGPVGAKSVAAMLAVRPELTKMRLGQNLLGDDGTITICKALSESKVSKLRELDLAWNDIGPASTKALSDMLLVCAELTKLGLGTNSLGDDGTITICKALSESKVSKLQELDLSQNGIGPPGVEALGNMLLVRSELTKLGLRNNSLGDAGSITICKALSESKVSKLQELDLSWNGIGPPGGEALGNMLLVRGELTSLYLSWNKLGPAGAVALAPGLAASAKLTSINILSNQLDIESATMLLKIKAEKPNLRTLCGLTHEETKISLINEGLGPGDAMLLAPEIVVITTLTTLNLANNQIGGHDQDDSKAWEII